MTKSIAPVKPNSSLALERLRHLVDSHSGQGEYQLPPERELAEELGVGRRAVRRALQVLEAEGRVWRRQGAGTFVNSTTAVAFPHFEDLTDQTDFFEVMEARLRLEPGLAQLAALRATASDVERLRELAAKTDAASDADAIELWDSALHRRIAVAAGNTLLLALFDVTNKVRENDAWRSVRDLARNHGNLSLYTKQHTQIVDAIAARDPLAAEAAMRRHILALQENLFAITSGALSHAS